MTLAELLALIAAGLADLDDAALAQLETDLLAEAEARADATSDEALAELEQIAEAVDTVRAENEQRETAAAERQDRAAAALERIRGQQDDGDGGDTADDDTADDADDDDADADDAGDAPADDTPAEQPVEQPQAVAAGAAPARPRIGRVNARRPAVARPRPASVPPASAWGLVASANLPGFTAGERLDDAEKLARAFQNAIETSAGYRGGVPVKIPVAMAGNRDPRRVGFTEDRYLNRDAEANMRKIEAAQSLQTLQAAGGICLPQNVRYDLPIVGDDARPVKAEMLNRFGADRGGVTTIPPPLLTEMTGAVGAWTHENDVDPGSDGPATKPCLTVTCPDEDTTLVEAITECLRFGVFRQRFAPEQIEAWIRLTGVWAARFAESRMLTSIGTGSTQVTSGQLLGATRDVLTTLDRAVAAMRSRHRISGAFPLRFGAPFWLRDMIRTDLARELPGSADERLAVADATIEGFIRARNVNVTWFLDGETGQIFEAQGDGPLNPWPSVVVTYLYPEGSWLGLDGGELNLGIYRDDDLVGTNDVKMFSETFENVHFHGVESQRIAMDLCPDGTVSGTVDIDPCTTGS
jgi:hypothetical protein